MFTVALYGAGKIGVCITALLTSSGRYKVRVCDHDLEQAKKVAAISPQATAHKLDLNDPKSIEDSLAGSVAVLSALPFFCNVQVATAAAQRGIHYLDLTEDVQTTKSVMKLAAGAKSAFMPQCGLAPGFISIAAADLARSFDALTSIKMRVGALPLFPSNRLKYNLTWSTDGLINEYCNPCEAIINGEMRTVLPLEGYERFSLDGDDYEAFNTSGGLGTLCETLAGKVPTLDYKTVRYIGHRDLMAFLLHDLQFINDRATLKDVFERSLPTTPQDKCIVFVEVRGQRQGRFEQRSYASTIYHQPIKIGAGFQHFGAIQLTTASGICAPLDLLLTGKLRSSGFVRCEEIALSQFLENEFGKYYLDERAMAALRS